MRLNIRSIILIIIGILVLVFGIKAIKSSGNLSADMNTKTQTLNNAIEQ